MHASVNKPHDYSGYFAETKLTYTPVLGREMRKDGWFLFLFVQYAKEQSRDQNPTRNLGASSLVEHVCFGRRVTCHCTTTRILPPVTERLLFLGQMLHVSLRGSW